MEQHDNLTSIELSASNGLGGFEHGTSGENARASIPDHAEPEHASSLPPADEGMKAWLFLAGCFMIEALVWGFCFTFGIFQRYYSTQAMFEDSGNIATIGTTALGIMYISAPIMFAALLAWPQIRRLATIVGLTVMCIGLAASSFATTTNQLIATQGVLYAIGGIAIYSPTILFLDEWFVRRKGLAFGIMWAGTGLAGVILPLVMDWALSTYDFRTVLRAWSVALFVMTAPLLHFVKPRLPPSRTRTFDFSFLLSPTFGLLELGNIIESLGYFLPSIFLPTYAQSLGASSYLAALTVVLFNVASVAGCIIMGFLIDRYHVTVCIGISTVGSTIGVFFLWGMSTSLGLLYVFCIFYGLFAGSFSSTWPGIMRLVKSETARAEPTMVFAFLAAGRGVGNVISGPLSEKLIAGTPWKNALLGYGTGYGPLIVFTGATAFLGGISVLGRKGRTAEMLR